MNKCAQFFRFLFIQYVLAKHGLDNVLASLPAFSACRFITWFNPWHWFRNKKTFHRGKALKEALEELGPIFVKFGQALSTRRDILPLDIADELAKLQDKVAPFKSELAIKILNQTYGCPLTDIFKSFDETPLASASMAQVHRATLPNDTEVVVKILRPNMRKLIKKDIKLLYFFAKLIEKTSKEAQRLKPVAIVSEFEETLMDELNLIKEAANGSQLKRNFAHSELLYIPTIYWDYVRHNILVMEKINGIPISDITRLKDNNINIEKLAKRGVEIFFRQVFEDCFFHADMHPGNIFVSSAFAANPKYICVDFGIVGSLTESDQRYLAENLVAFFNRDYRRVANLHIASGWVPKNTRVTAFESAIRTVCEPIFERPLKDISFAQLIIQLFQTGQRFQMEVQPQLILLQKTLLAIEGLGRQLYPELDLWQTAKPFLEQWVKKQVGPQAFLKKMKENFPYIIEQLPQMPKLISEVLIEHKNYLVKQQDMPLTKNKTTSIHPFYTSLCLFPLTALGLSYLLSSQNLAILAVVSSVSGAILWLNHNSNNKE